jgi:hypothetical protein
VRRAIPLLLRGPVSPASFEIAATARGYRVVRGVPGIHVVVDGEQIEIRSTRVGARAWRCEFGEERSEALLEDRRRVAGFRVEAVGPARRTLLLRPPELEYLEEVVDEVEVVATIGPYAAIRRALYTYSPCDPHGLWHTLHVWRDLRGGRRLDLVREAPADRSAVREGRRRIVAGHRRRDREGLRRAAGRVGLRSRSRELPARSSIQGAAGAAVRTRRGGCE